MWLAPNSYHWEVMNELWLHNHWSTDTLRPINAEKCHAKVLQTCGIAVIEGFAAPDLDLEKKCTIRQVRSWSRSCWSCYICCLFRIFSSAWSGWRSDPAAPAVSEVWTTSGSLPSDSRSCRCDPDWLYSVSYHRLTRFCSIAASVVGSWLRSGNPSFLILPRNSSVFYCPR